MVNLKEQSDFFELVGKELKEKVECFVIGGSAMMFHGAKVDTKDVDLVFLNKRELEQVKKTLSNIGFEEKKSLVKIFKHYKEKHKYKPIMMVRNQDRFDLFLKEVICFKISNTIIERIKENHEFNNLIVKVVSPEDIILLKSATEREKDKIDALNLIKKFDIDWNIIIKESIHQTKLGKYLFPIFLFDFLYELKENLKADIPKDIINKIRNIGERLLLEKLKK